MTNMLHVAVGAVVDAQGLILIARRPPQVHLGGLWEFPGGKLEAGESVRQALARELAEEIGIQVISCRPLIQLCHRYPEREVLLDVWRVEAFSGQAHGRENQPVAWVAAEELHRYAFPEGNRPIIAALRLPSCYAIVNAAAQERAEEVEARLQGLAERGVSLAQLRAPDWPAAAYRALAQRLLLRAESLGLRLLLNAEPSLAQELGAAGVHLPAARLLALPQRPLPAGFWVAASCHNAEELAQAERIGADFAVLSPVLPTASHPQAQPIGWDGFARWTTAANLPVYALGGLSPADLQQAWRHGAQGIAAIRGLA